MLMPPSAQTRFPVTNVLSSPAGNSAVRAISRGEACPAERDVRVDADQHEPGALGREHPRHRHSEASLATRDQPGVAAQSPHFRPPHTSTAGKYGGKADTWPSCPPARTA
jgi:hypothetical protein